eukprot:SAG25_NODE_1624_length_2655_cov_7.113067_2_plen_93_part_01
MLRQLRFKACYRASSLHACIILDIAQSRREERVERGGGLKGRGADSDTLSELTASVFTKRVSRPNVFDCCVNRWSTTFPGRYPPSSSSIASVC